MNAAPDAAPAALKPMRTRISVAQSVPQRPGCLPDGYDLDSMLTVGQFAVWQQVGYDTALAAHHSMKGVFKRSREWRRVHPRTFLEVNTKK